MAGDKAATILFGISRSPLLRKKHSAQQERTLDPAGLVTVALGDHLTTASRRRHSPPSRDLSLRVGKLVRDARLRKNISQAALGAPYYTRAMVSAVELGKVTPALKALAHFASVLGVKLRDLIPED